MRKSKLIEYSPILLVMIMVLLLSLHMHWQGDAVAFSFFIPAENEDFSFIPLNNIWDIWPSMCNHWHNSTGRFFTHAIVQLYCAFIGKTGFAISNAFVWGCLLVLILKMSKLKSIRFSLVAIASLLIFVSFFPVNGFREQSFPFEPPHQINYVWMGLWNLSWIYIFLKEGERKTKWYNLILLAVFSFLGGQSNESFSIPIGGAILAYFFRHKCDMSLRRYVMAICYGIGALFVIFAPGNFQRLGLSPTWSVAHTVESLLPGLLIPSLLLLSLILDKKFGVCDTAISKTDFGFFILTSIIINFLLGIGLGMGSGVRMLTCANLLMTILILTHLGNINLRPFIGIAMLLILVTAGIYRYVSISKLNHKNIVIENLYHESEDGIVVLPDDQFLYQVRSFIVRPHPYMMKERSINPAKPNIYIRPKTMMSLNLDVDTNMMISLSPQAWLLIQSKKSPADFKIDKVLLPGILNFQLPERKMEWNNAYTAFDSTDLWRAAIYINERPYIHSEIRLDGK